MNLNNPLEGLFPGGHGKVLFELLRQPESLSGRSIALLLGDKLGKSRVLQILGDLVDTGVVHREILGSAHRYSINKDHLLFPALKQLVNPLLILRRRILDSVRKWELQPVSVHIFGSVAKGNSTHRSDIDLLLIRPDAIEADSEAWEAQTFELTVELEVATGNTIQLVEYSESEYRRLLKAGARLTLEVEEFNLEIVGRLMKAS